MLKTFDPRYHVIPKGTFNFSRSSTETKSDHELGAQFAAEILHNPFKGRILFMSYDASIKSCSHLIGFETKLNEFAKSGALMRKVKIVVISYINNERKIYIEDDFDIPVVHDPIKLYEPAAKDDINDNMNPYVNDLTPVTPLKEGATMADRGENNYHYIKANREAFISGAMFVTLDSKNDFSEWRKGFLKAWNSDTRAVRKNVDILFMFGDGDGIVTWESSI